MPARVSTRAWLTRALALLGACGFLAAAPSAEGFDRTVELLGVSFHVTCPNDSSLNTVTIRTAGLAIDNRPVTRRIDGSVTGAEGGDLDGDGSPEIYVFVASAGSGSYGTMVAFAANNGRSLSEIHLPPLAAGAGIAEGYRGHDTFSVAGGRLMRRYPIYRPGDANSHPTGGVKALRYELVTGEAGWLLKPLVPGDPAGAGAPAAADDMKPFPPPGPGMRRFVIRVPEVPLPDERRVEVQIGRSIEVDCNRHTFAVTVARHVVEGWGYPYYTVGEFTGPMSTRRACPPGEPMRREFVVAGAGELEWLPYNSRLPIVVYVPADVEVRYRIWAAGEAAAAAEPR